MWNRLSLLLNEMRAGDPTQPLKFSIWGNDIRVYDAESSKASRYIAWELTRDAYRLGDLPFRTGDCVVDIGAHIGMVSIALALRFPFLKIYAYEPYPPNRALLERNLALNGVTQVTVNPEALTADGRDIEMTTNPTNSGGAGAFAKSLQSGRYSRIPSISLDDLFERHSIQHCALLKLDCEGAEYEVLQATRVWDRIGVLCGEFHSNQFLESLGHSPARLRQYCAARLTPQNVRVNDCAISE
jgi:FkbM family methyltransferase